MEITSLGRTLLDLFFPIRCLNCGDILPQRMPLCVLCAADLPYTHWNLDRENFAFEKLRSLCRIEAAFSLLEFRHDNVTQKLLHNLKYNNHPEIGELLAEKTAERLNLSEYQGIIPVPVHPKKLKKRGYNQVVPFAKRLSDIFCIPMLEGGLKRKENNKSQVSKSRSERLSSIKDSFASGPPLPPGHYILADDTLTTGATLSICAELLNGNNRNRISVVTMACAL